MSRPGFRTTRREPYLNGHLYFATIASISEREMLINVDFHNSDLIISGQSQELVSTPKHINIYTFRIRTIQGKYCNYE